MVALGLRVKSGWASAVLIGGSRRAPRFLARWRVALADPRVPRSTQPYHAGFGSLQKDAAVLRRLVSVVQRATARSLTAVLRDCRVRRQMPRAVALVVGSTIDPERIGNEHIRAHAYEGQLFRSALERAARRRGLESRVVRERDLSATAVSELRRPKAAIARVIVALGRAAGKPWRGEEKTAAVAAWMLLA